MCYFVVPMVYVFISMIVLSFCLHTFDKKIHLIQVVVELDNLRHCTTIESIARLVGDCISI
jgi:hypothetical protein